MACRPRRTRCSKGGRGRTRDTILSWSPRKNQRRLRCDEKVKLIKLEGGAAVLRPVAGKIRVSGSAQAPSVPLNISPSVWLRQPCADLRSACHGGMVGCACYSHLFAIGRQKVPTSATKRGCERTKSSSTVPSLLNWIDNESVIPDPAHTWRRFRQPACPRPGCRCCRCRRWWCGRRRWQCR